MKDAEGNVLELKLGYEDTSVTVTSDLGRDETVGNNADKAIASYNNAPAYHSTNYDEWSPVTIDVARGDIQYEQDLVKLSYFGIAATEENYWLASHNVNEDEINVNFNVNYVEGGMMTNNNLWNVNLDGNVNGNSYAYGVRFVASIN